VTLLVAAVAGALAGALAGLLLLRRSAWARAEVLLQAWQVEEGRAIGAGAAAEARLSVKARLPTVEGIDLLAADCRWLGDPVLLVAFDGDSEVKAAEAPELRAVTFVSGPGTEAAEEAAAVAECVAAGRVRWVTLRLPAAPEAGGRSPVAGTRGRRGG
jgi:hypothetical protein